MRNDGSGDLPAPGDSESEVRVFASQRYATSSCSKARAQAQSGGAAPLLSVAAQTRFSASTIFVLPAPDTPTSKLNASKLISWSVQLVLRSVKLKLVIFMGGALVNEAAPTRQWGQADATRSSARRVSAPGGRVSAWRPGPPDRPRATLPPPRHVPRHGYQRFPISRTSSRNANGVLARPMSTMPLPGDGNGRGAGRDCGGAVRKYVIASISTPL